MPLMFNNCLLHGRSGTPGMYVEHANAVRIQAIAQCVGQRSSRPLGDCIGSRLGSNRLMDNARAHEHDLAPAPDQARGQHLRKFKRATHVHTKQSFERRNIDLKRCLARERTRTVREEIEVSRSSNRRKGTTRRSKVDYQGLKHNISVALGEHFNSAVQSSRIAAQQRNFRSGARECSCQRICKGKPDTTRSTRDQSPLPR